MGPLKLRRYLAERGIGYLLVVVPDKQTIYPEHVPAAKAQMLRPSALNAVLASLDIEDRTAVIDLRPALLAAKQERQVYFRTDSHWNGSGGWIGYRSILAGVQRQLGVAEGPIQPLPAVRAAGEVSGDLARMLGISHGFIESQQMLASAPGATGCAKNEVGEPPSWVAPRQLLRCRGAAFPRAAIYHDSMGLELLGLLANEWQESLWVSRRQWDLEALAQQAPVMVIDEVVERSLPALADISFLGGAGAARAPTVSAVGPWKRGLPPTSDVSSSPQAISCSLDLVNGKPGLEVTLPGPGKDFAMVIEGWAADVGAGQLPTAVSIVLSGAGTSYFLPAELRRPRPDVASAFGKPGLAAAGYRLVATAADLPVGDYRVAIAWQGVHGAASCDSRKVLRILAQR